MITGDFNDFDVSFLSENFQLLDCVIENTRSNAILDHVLVDESLREFYSALASIGPPLKHSDHNCIFLQPDSAQQPSLWEERKLVMMWNLRDSCITKFLHRLSTVNFDGLHSNVKESHFTVEVLMSNFHHCLFVCLSDTV